MFNVQCSINWSKILKFMRQDIVEQSVIALIYEMYLIMTIIEKLFCQINV